MDQFERENLVTRAVRQLGGAPGAVSLTVAVLPTRESEARLASVGNPGQREKFNFVSSLLTGRELHYRPAPECLTFSLQDPVGNILRFSASDGWNEKNAEWWWSSRHWEDFLFKIYPHADRRGPAQTTQLCRCRGNTWRVQTPLWCSLQYWSQWTVLLCSLISHRESRSTWGLSPPGRSLSPRSRCVSRGGRRAGQSRRLGRQGF